ncbi:MAG: type 3 domain protein, partial [Candidatus Saccharibacteria bacterium]|nr:type 3 domain protein [Candidatus Saccharibacteria bacterium]
MRVTRPSRRLFLTGLTVVVLAAVGYSLGIAGLFVPQPAARAAERLTYWIEDADPAAKQQIEAAIRSSGWIPDAAARGAADLEFSLKELPATAGVLPVATAEPAALTGATLLKPLTRFSYYAGIPTTSPVGINERTEIISKLHQTKFDSGSEWSMVAVGDIGLGRSVYTQMKAAGDMTRPYRYFKDTLSAADLAVANLECAVSDDKAVITNSGMTFVAPYEAAAGLKDSGIDAVSLANNHAFNGGADGYRDTLAELKRLGLTAFGGGLNATEAHTERIMTVKGVKVALLGYSSIAGSTAATDHAPGMAHIPMAPWGRYAPSESDQMAADIAAARTRADVVIPYFHWGTEYTHVANADQRAVAHRAIEAGADLVLGAHPHWVQGVEWYQGKLIAYSLGNFVFDQSWAEQTKQGTVLKLKFQGKQVTAAELVPYEIH